MSTDPPEAQTKEAGLSKELAKLMVETMVDERYLNIYFTRDKSNLQS